MPNRISTHFATAPSGFPLLADRDIQWADDTGLLPTAKLLTLGRLTYSTAKGHPAGPALTKV